MSGPECPIVRREGGGHQKFLVGYGKLTWVRTWVSGPDVRTGCPDRVSWPGPDVRTGCSDRASGPGVRFRNSAQSRTIDLKPFHSVSHLFLPLFCPPSLSTIYPLVSVEDYFQIFSSFFPLTSFEVDLFPLNFTIECSSSPLSFWLFTVSYGFGLGFSTNMFMLKYSRYYTQIAPQDVLSTPNFSLHFATAITLAYS